MPTDDELGVAFPVVDGRRGTTATGTAILADAARDVDPALAARIEAARGWRQGYVDHFADLLVASARTDAAAVSVARDGLASLHRRMVVAGPDGGSGGGAGDGALADWLGSVPAEPLREVVVEGDGERERELSVPYAGSRLRGDDLRRRLDDWVARGIVEPSHAEAVRAVQAHPEWLDLSDVEFALLGAAAEMAPLRSLLRWGATVRAVDVRRPDVWRPVLDVARAGAGRLVVPVRGDSSDVVGLDSAAGADLLTEGPAVLDWLASAGRPLVVGNYVYADGAVFTRLSTACDALSAALAHQEPGTALAMLATPTDVFAVPPEVVTAARSRYLSRGPRRMVQAPARAFSGGRLFRPNYQRTVRLPDGREYGVADALVVQQGPNYALAKHVQRWRALAATADGLAVSANVAPPTRTRSVLRNRLLAAAYAGAHRFGVEVFAPATSSTLMAALLVRDLRCPAPELAHPHDLFVRGANHGGLWRVAYEPRSVLGLAVLLGLTGRS